MKNLILFCGMFYGTLALAQHTTFSFRQSLDEVPVTLGFKKFDTLPKALTVYSPTAMMTNEYTPLGNGYLRTDVSDLPVTINGITTDSFNPNGAINVQTALGMGLVRTVFKL